MGLFQALVARQYKRCVDRERLADREALYKPTLASGCVGIYLLIHSSKKRILYLKY